MIQNGTSLCYHSTDDNANKSNGIRMEPEAESMIQSLPIIKSLRNGHENGHNGHDMIPKITITRPSLGSSPSLNTLGDESLEIIKLTFMSFKGIILSFLSSIFFSLTAVIVKYLHEIHPGEMACFRFLGILLFSLPLVLSCGENPFGPRHLRHYIIIRGIAGATSLYLRYCALQYLPLADATVIVLSMPVFVCIFARIFLKEPCGIFHVIALAVTLIGIGFTTKLNIIFNSSSEEAEAAGINTQNEIYGLASGMGATLIGSSAYILVRKVKGLHHSVILFNFAWVAIIETTVITASLKGFSMPECGLSPWLLMILAVLSFYGQLLLTMALQAEEAGLVSVTRSSSEVAFAFIFQIIMFRQMPDLYSVLGALLVTSAVLLTSARKWVITLPDTHWGRRYLGFVTL